MLSPSQIKVSLGKPIRIPDRLKSAGAIAHQVHTGKLLLSINNDDVDGVML
ncbi:predicted protein [Sclerotinia sclerotiorum 1980 UF-70]|uniref:Uncharacterized protein n=1 Tax=Sclerotinia sclerotiorum (strain ATCC 18683 / 1980 / Ss-1) TaxID=665079 RepID=A7EGP3_SCLS1|nr:predicted protein [Sclerotinia sclerotiorum 1980 UF-70]EDO02009.1 predicted protein [Sclerotinia sclerotiorum 1980 UF-70]